MKYLLIPIFFALGKFDLFLLFFFTVCRANSSRTWAWEQFKHCMSVFIKRKNQIYFLNLNYILSQNLHQTSFDIE